MSAPKLSVLLPIITPTPFLRAMTEFCIKTLRANARRPNDYELIVVEAKGDHFDPAKHDFGGDPLMRVDQYLRFEKPLGQIPEQNRGMDLARGEFIVQCSNDVIVSTEGWEDALIEPFLRYPDCGVSALSGAEPGAVIGPYEPLPMIVEGMYSPFMMFKKHWRYDEAYPGAYSDSDLVMRMYAQGLRAYRSCRARVIHLNHMTYGVAMDAKADQRVTAIGEKLFYERWGNSPLMMFALMRSGGYQFGREHESWMRPITLHPMPASE